MNRIVVDKDIIDISDDNNYLVEKHYKKNIININSNSVNILNIKEENASESYEININHGKAIINNFLYNIKDIDITVNLNSEKSEIILYNSVISSSLVNVNIKINHNFKNTTSNIYNNGATIKKGAINFNVISKVSKNIKGCIVNQESKIISLNDNNDNKISPILLIDEYDVEAKHSAFIGKFDENELFYLQSRGLCMKDATSLLLDGMLIGTLKVCFEEKKLLKEKLKRNWR